VLCWRPSPQVRSPSGACREDASRAPPGTVPERDRRGGSRPGRPSGGGAGARRGPGFGEQLAARPVDQVAGKSRKASTSAKFEPSHETRPRRSTAVDAPGSPRSQWPSLRRKQSRLAFSMPSAISPRPGLQKSRCAARSAARGRASRSGHGRRSALRVEESSWSRCRARALELAVELTTAGARMTQRDQLVDQPAATRSTRSVDDGCFRCRSTRQVEAEPTAGMLA